MSATVVTGGGQGIGRALPSGCCDRSRYVTGTVIRRRCRSVLGNPESR